MIPQIESAFQELAERARRRGDATFYGSLEQWMGVYTTTYGGEFPRLEGFDELMTQYSYDHIHTMALLLKARDDACSPDCKDRINVRRVIHGQRIYVGTRHGPGLEPDLIPNLIIGGFLSPLVGGAGAGAGAIGEGIGGTVVPRSNPIPSVPDFPFIGA